MKLRIAVVAGAMVLGIAAVAAQSADDQAKAAMKNQARNLGALASMAKGDKPYDQATVDAAIAQLQETGKKLPTLFPDSMKGAKPSGDYSPSPKIWENRADFDSHIDICRKAVNEAATSAKDVDTLKASIAPIAKACGGCHQTYRVKNG